MVVLDLDGTLLDSAPGIGDALNRTLAEAGRPPLTLAQTTALIGDGARDLVRRAFEGTGDALAEAEVTGWFERFIAIYEPVAAHSTPAFPGVAETLAALHGAGWRLGVCTNKPASATRAVLRALDFEAYFGAVVGGGAGAPLKPDPRHLLAVLEALGACAHEAVMVGDAENDVKVARAAGVPVVCVRYGYARGSPESLGADALIDRFDALPAALAQLA